MSKHHPNPSARDTAFIVCGTMIVIACLVVFTIRPEATTAAFLSPVLMLGGGLFGRGLKTSVQKSWDRTTRPD